ncbi:TonB-dependent receptor [Roseateles sp. DC23W]|uniref:TonB-dependent receptor n=1 Tax=Pelomonas dachongensis TaxID=3299029 RepID=A0ABW7ELG1_9BURK
MHKRTLLSKAAVAALGLIASSAFAQTQGNAQQLERIEITGSAIKRLDAETAVPVTVIKMDDLKSQGVTSVEQILGLLSSVQGTQNMASAVGSGTGGATFADMRGLGANKTLVLLNGQRIANSATGSASAPDMNMIPFAAITRVEVLRDGASALYGTDAIGGVINFITRNNLTGGSFSAGYDAPQKSGGSTSSASATYGFGDLGRDGWNVYGALSYKKRNEISGTERDFNKRFVGGLSNSTFPANYQVQQGGDFYNPIATGCAAPNLISNAAGCQIVTPPFVSISPKSETLSGLVKGTFDVSPALRLGAELFYSKNSVEVQTAPVPYGSYWINPGTTYFPTAALTKPNYSPTFDPYELNGEPFNSPTAQFPNPVNLQQGGVLVWFRDVFNGPRRDKSTGEQYRALFTAEGNAAGWDYKAALAYNNTENNRKLTAGYANGEVIGEGLIRGIINPFGAQTPEALALIQGAALKGLLSTSEGKVTSFTASAGRELGDWFNATRPVQIAVGTEYRQEEYVDFNHRDFAALVSASTGVDPDARSEGDRKVYAFYGELNVPLTKELEVSASVRYDKYNDFGNTTNPKVSFRYQPLKELLVRGSASTGFRAPSLYELNATTGFTNTAGNTNNPLNCPGGVLVSGATSGANCKTQFQSYFGGNKDLKPEESKSFTLGLVFEPVKGFTTSVDLWSVEVEQQIGSIAEGTLFLPANQQIFSQYFKYLPGNLLSQNTRDCQGGPTSPTCGYVDVRTQNLGGVKTNGIDLGLQYQVATSMGRLGFEYQGTFVNKYDYQDYKDGPWNQNVGVFSGSGPVFKWQHNLSSSWSKDGWGAGLALHHKSGYVDQDPTNKVKAYTTADAYVSFSPMKAVSLLLGVRNLTDRDPPLTYQNELFQSGGWDSRFYDPVGRTVYVRGTVNF